ncbi:MAG: PorV/PorQ family protein [Caldithrix sp.]|nr:PorV/PorQ family protein [Caldithrix sp.]
MNRLSKSNGLIYLVLLLFLASVPLLAGDEDRIGTAAGTQLQIPVGARDLAMSGSDIVFTTGVDALYWNPAGLSHMENKAAGLFSTITVFNDIQVNYLAVGTNLGAIGHLAFSVKALDFGDIPLTTLQDMDGASGKTFSPTFSTIGLTYANKLTNAIQVGVTGKVLYESIPRVSGSAVAFDLGLQYQNLAGIEGVSFGIVANNIGTNMQYAGTGLGDQTRSADGKTEFLTKNAETNQLPASLNMGVSYDYQVMPKNNLIVSGTFQNSNLENDAVKFGAEYGYDNMLFLRGGYRYTANTDTDALLYTFTLGAGFQYKLGNTVLGIDYAFRDSQYFNANNMFDLKIAF